jgi:hypothetical protein
MLEVEQASLNTEAKARLSEIRSQLGLSAPTQAAPVEAAPAQEATPTEGSSS